MPISNPPLPPANAPLIAGADGTQTIAEIAEKHPGVPMVAMGKQTIMDVGKRLAQIRGLKPGSSSIRTPEMIESILERLTEGETLTAILLDYDMPSRRTLDGWRDRDPDLNAAIMKAQASGQHALADLRMNIAMQGEFSTGDARRDELLIKAINANIAQRNRAEFGEKVHHEHSRVTLNLPDWAVAVSCQAAVERLDDNAGDDPDA